MYLELATSDGKGGGAGYRLHRRWDGQPLGRFLGQHAEPRLSNGADPLCGASDHVKWNVKWDCCLVKSNGDVT